MGLELIDIGPKSLEVYEDLIGRERVEEVRDLAARLRGRRVLHLNSTAYGGGVAELLRSILPLYRSLGIEADWMVIPGGDEFFEVTKSLHNALQGGAYDFPQADRDTYLHWNEKFAHLYPGGYDYVVVHDPQPALLRALHGRGESQWVWRCHIDTSNPIPEVQDYLQPYILEYDALVFTMDAYVSQALREGGPRIEIIPPAIDPLSPKNLTLPEDLSRQIVQWTGVHLDRLLVTQVSRFDPWKDPLGVVEVYRRVRKEVPGLQLALLGSMALDDPEGWKIYHRLLDETQGNPDIHVLTNLTGISNVEVNAFQSCSNVVLQKSIREGFGLVVSEALWKGTPVVAGRVGGIPMQMPEGTGGYLVDSIEECAERTLHLLRDTHEARELGAMGRAHVRENYLITRLLRDELALLASLD